MENHPHVHLLVPGGVISATSKDGLQWIPLKRKKFLVPKGMLSDIFRARFIKLARKALPHNTTTFPQSVWKKRWVVHIKPFKKGGQKVLEYLARYIHRIAITNNRILADDNGQITFKYQNSTTGKWKTMPLPALEFMRRFLQHVLPGGFHKVRYYGFLTPKYKETFYSLKLILETSNGKIIDKLEGSDTGDTSNYFRRCPKCKLGIMRVVVHIFYRKTTLPFARPPPCKK